MSEEKSMTLAPCPFCRGTRVKAEDDNFHEYASRQFVVTCRCGAHGPNHPTEQEAIDAWNTRPVDPRIAELEAVLKAAREWWVLSNAECGCDNCVLAKRIDALIGGAK